MRQRELAIQALEAGRAVAVEALWAHPPADELDRGIRHAGSVERCGESRAVRVEGVDGRHRFAVEKGKDPLEQVAEGGVCVRLSGGVGEESAS